MSSAAIFPQSRKRPCFDYLEAAVAFTTTGSEQRCIGEPHFFLAANNVRRPSFGKVHALIGLINEHQSDSDASVESKNQDGVYVYQDTHTRILHDLALASNEIWWSRAEKRVPTFARVSQSTPSGSG